jgi:hypothetical protein
MRAQAALQSAREAVKNAIPTAREANVTDPESRIMKTKDGWVQGYNAQAIVNQHQIVLACEVSQNAGDVELYEPMITTLTAAKVPVTTRHPHDPAGPQTRRTSTANKPCRSPRASPADHRQPKTSCDSLPTTTKVPGDRNERTGGHAPASSSTGATARLRDRGTVEMRTPRNRRDMRPELGARSREERYCAADDDAVTSRSPRRVFVLSYRLNV